MGQGANDRDQPGRAYSSPRQPTGDTTATPAPEIDCHGTLWVNGELQLPIGGSVLYRGWSFTTVMGEKYGAGSDVEDRSPLYYFMAMMPPTEMSIIVNETNRQLQKNRNPVITKGELLKLFGVIILMSRFEFAGRRSLWSRQRPSKYVPSPQLGDTGMSRNRFDTLVQCLRFSVQPEARPASMRSEQYRWRLVDDFVSNFNEHRHQMFSPSDLICVDESMRKWYGMGGFWINAGLPQYIAIDRKPSNGCEIQNAACGRSGVMLKLKLVKTAESEDASASATGNGLTHSCNVLRDLIAPWDNSGRIVCADSYFASVQFTEELIKMGLRFIGVVKTATKRFPMRALGEMEMERRGDHRGLLYKGADGQPIMLSYVWMDRDRRYFISSTSSLKPGTPYNRKRYRQIASVVSNELPELVELTVPQPEACDIYYSCCAKIDQHNRCRQDDLQLKRKMGTHDWSMRVHMSILGMIVVDSWLVYKGARNDRLHITQGKYYSLLAEKLIENTYDSPIAARRTFQPHESQAIDEGVPMSGIGAHLTPTKRRRKESNYKQQGRCLVCVGKTTHECSKCRVDSGANAGRGFWICHSKTGASCFATHMANVHRQ